MRARYRLDQALLDAVLSGDPALDVFEAASLGDVERLRELLDAIRRPPPRTQPTGSPRCTSRRSSAGSHAPASCWTEGPTSTRAGGGG